MDTKISKYKVSAKRSKTAYLNILNKELKRYNEKIDEINAQIDYFKNYIINPDTPQMESELKYAKESIKENTKNIETIQVFKNELLNFVEPKISKKIEELEIKNIYKNLKDEYSKIYNQCRTKILNESINTREENLKSFEELEEQEKANIESATEIQKFMRAFNSKQGTQKNILENQARKKYKENKKEKKHKKTKT